MKHLSAALIAIFATAFFTLAIAVESYSQAESLRVMTYNIRYDNPDDAPNNWHNRKARVANLIAFCEPAFVGTQEALFHQLSYLDRELPNYNWIGKGRKDGQRGGEFSALLYDSRKAKLVARSDSTIWLSQTPGVPSKSWDAALPRILTWGRFEIKKGNRQVYVFNTHFDHRGHTARAESAKLILQTIQKVADGTPVILTGDFNITKESKPYHILTSSFLTDTYHATASEPVGPRFTYNGFSAADTSGGRRIDYIFINSAFSVSKVAISSSFKNGYFPSDHLPVVTDLILK